MASIFSNPVVAMIIMLGGLVLFHEAGHFFVGKWCGVAVETFSIGFGKTIFSRRHGHTTYQVSWLPLGGYVKFYGSTRNEDVPEGVTGLYTEAAVWKRALIVLAGPAANFLLAFLIFWGMVMAGIERPPATVGDVIEGGRAQVAGVMPGDEFVQIDGEDVKVWTDIERIISKNPERALPVVVERAGKRVELTITPEAVPGVSLFGSRTKIGRAGVALGYPSAVVAVVDPNSIVAKSGLKTGDRVEHYTINGTKSRVLGFHHLLKLLKRWKHDGVDDVELYVEQVQVVEDGAAKVSEKTVGEPRSVMLHVRDWPVSDKLTDRAYAKQLGVLDSHLTIAVVHGDATSTLLPGDQIVNWNGDEVRTIYHLQEMMSDNVNPKADIDVIRNGKLEKLAVKLKPYETQRPEGAVTVYVLDVAMLGMSTMPDPVIEQHSNPLTAASVAVNEAYRQTSVMVISLWSIVTGQTSLKALGGPIMIAKVAGDSAKAGFMTFVAMMAVISINLGLVNLFPIPVLDGGQLVMLGAEQLKGRPLTERTLENFQKLGFVLVLCLIVLAMYNDLSRFWKSMISSFMG